MEIFFPIKRKRVNNCFKPLILSAFTTATSRLESEQKKGKINLETKCNMVSTNTYKINENFSFPSNNKCSYAIIHHISKDAHAE